MAVAGTVRHSARAGEKDVHADAWIACDVVPSLRSFEPLPVR
jgi:hypothetical protein